MIPKISLQYIVINILACKCDCNLFYLHRFQSLHGQCAQSILHQHLIYPQLNFIARKHLPSDQTARDKLMAQVLP